MRNSKAILRDLQQQITLKEDISEIRSILFIVMENVLGLTQAEIFADKSIAFGDNEQKKLTDVISRINNQEPVQYIFGSAYFYGRRFKVCSSVLIPRPETELLIEEVLKETKPFTPGAILDIGTGSGCIAVTLAKELPEKRIVAIDISEEALKVARQNASDLGASVEFNKVNALEENFPVIDLEMIVSNPPYIAVSETGDMKRNVVDFEPHLALFVPDFNPLVFYETIAAKGMKTLKDGGKAIVEINERFGKEVVAVFKEAGFKNARVIKDLREKDRIVIASK